MNSIIESYKEINKNIYKSTIKSSYIRLYNIYIKYVPNGETLFNSLSNDEKIYKLNLICTKKLLHKSMKEQFSLLIDNEYLTELAYKKYCDNKTKNMKEKVSSDKRYYSMNLESFIFREGIVEGTNSYNKFVENQKRKSKRCKEYYEIQGYSTDESIMMVSKHQSTFSKDKCIEKYGIEKGLEVWNERQNKWINTLANKSAEEIDEINCKKYPYNIDTLKLKYKDRWKEVIYNAFDIPVEYQKLNVHDYLYKYINPESMLHYSIDKMVQIVPKYIWTLFEINNYEDKISSINIMLEKYNLKIHNSVKFIDNTKIKRYHLYIPELDVVLRSSNEIYFYNLLKKYDIKFLSNKTYPNSRKFYDFYLIDFNQYIELTSFNEVKYPEYYQNIRDKMTKFKIVFLNDVKHYDSFLQSLIYSSADSSNSTSINVSG